MLVVQFERSAVSRTAACISVARKSKAGDGSCRPRAVGAVCSRRGFDITKSGLPAAGRFGINIRGFSSHLLAFEFLRQFTLKPLLFSGFQKKRVLLHGLNNAFLLDLSLETPKGALNGFAFENPDFCQNVPP